MMKKLLLAILLSITITPAFAEEARTITLKDGSVIQGEVTGMANGTYTVRTQAMGDVAIDQANIASIASPGLMPAQAAAPIPVQSMPSNITAMPEFQATQARVLADPELMGDIQKLIQDPDVMALMADPGFIAMVQSGKTDAISQDPRLKALSENPNVQALIEKIKSRQ